MERYEIRDPDDVRTIVAQGLLLQCALPPAPPSVKPVLDWCLEILSPGNPLPPVSLVADLGHVAFGLDREAPGLRGQVPVPGVPANLLSTYEDQVLGKIYADWSFSAACDALRRYAEGRDRARGLAFLVNRLRERAGFAGVDFSPGILGSLASESPDELLRQGYESLRKEGLHPYLETLYDSLITAARRMGDALGHEDILELQSGTALDEEGDRLAFRQVARAATRLEGSLPPHRLRPLPRRQEVPTRVLDEDTYPVGGFASISNRGSVESLLHSQLAYIEDEGRPDLFDIKYLRDELLYYSRDENQFLRRRRTFVFALYPDLAGSIRFKDADLPFQRGILLIAMLFVIVRKLSEWLSTDSLLFDFVLVVPDGSLRNFPLETECGLLFRLLRDESANGSVVFDFLLLPSGSKRTARNASGEEDFRAALRQRLPKGTINFTDATSTDAVAELCGRRAGRSLCHCLTISAEQRDVTADDTVVTSLRIDSSVPVLEAGPETPSSPAAEDALDCWSAVLRDILRRWI